MTKKFYTRVSEHSAVGGDCLCELGRGSFEVLIIFGVYADLTAKISPSVELEEEIMGTGPGSTNDIQSSKSKSIAFSHSQAVFH